LAKKIKKAKEYCQINKKQKEGDKKIMNNSTEEILRKLKTVTYLHIPYNDTNV